MAVEEEGLPVDEHVRDSCGLRSGFLVQAVGRAEPVDAGDAPEEQGPVIPAAHGGGDDAPQACPVVGCAVFVVSPVGGGVFYDFLVAAHPYAAVAGGEDVFHAVSLRQPVVHLPDAVVFLVEDVGYRKLADWSAGIISNLTDSQLQSILGVEHGGMVELLADASRIFGEQKYMDAAKRYCHTWLLDGMQTLNTTLLDGQHANSTVPKFMGFERIWQEQARSGGEAEERYRTAAHNFWEDVTGNRTVCIGGNSVSEHFIPAAQGSQYIDNLEGPETCNSYNMLKLSETLSDETHDARYADFYEATMFNHILSSQNPRTGGFVYFTTLRPQSYRIYSTVDLSLWCCVGTGLENHSRYGHFIYTRSEGNDTLYVNLFTPSRLESDKFQVTQENSYPEQPSTRITMDQGGRFTLAVRHPWWTTDGYAVKVNGEAADIDVTAGESGYAFVERDWKEGDVVEVSIPMELRYEECPDYPDYIAFKYGPVLLAAQTTASSMEEAEAGGLAYEDLPNQFADGSRWGHSPASMATPKSLSSAPLLIGAREEVLGRITPSGQPLQFDIDVESEWVKNGWDKLRLVPFYRIHEARYQCYWYNRTADEFKDSDMALADSLEMVLEGRTIDFVGTGEPQSELAHEAEYSETSNTGIAGNELYRDVKAGGYIQYTLFNHAGKTDSVSILCRFNVFDHDRQSAIYIDGVKLTDVVVPETTGKANAQGLFDMEYPIPAEMMKNEDGTPKEQIVFRLQASETTMARPFFLESVVSWFGRICFQNAGFMPQSVTRPDCGKRQRELELLKNGRWNCTIRAFLRPNPDFFAARNFRLC